MGIVEAWSLTNEERHDDECECTTCEKMKTRWAPCTDAMEAIFNAVDTDGSGSLDKAEIVRVMKGVQGVMGEFAVLCDTQT